MMKLLRNQHQTIGHVVAHLSNIIHSVDNDMDAHVIKNECKCALNLIKKLEKIESGDDNTKFKLGASELAQRIQKYFDAKNIKMDIDFSSELGSYRVWLNDENLTLLEALYQNIDDHGDLSKNVELRIKIIDENLLIVVKNHFDNNHYNWRKVGGGLDKIEDYCLRNGGKARFLTYRNHFYTRVFLPVKAERISLPSIEN